MTDVRMFIGGVPVETPVTLGHEFSGVVGELGGVGEAAYRGAGRVVSIETNGERRAEAVRNGAEVSLDPRGSSFTEAFQTAAEGRGAEGFDMVPSGVCLKKMIIPSASA